jgi:hypothetical protein
MRARKSQDILRLQVFRNGRQCPVFDPGCVETLSAPNVDAESPTWNRATSLTELTPTLRFANTVEQCPIAKRTPLVKEPRKAGLFY